MKLDPVNKSLLVIGLTGGIATGKSEVSCILRELGATIIDADRLGHEAYQPQTPIWQDVVDTFGEEILQSTGEIDRRRLGTIVFSDPDARKKLNSIMHPKMAEMIHEKIGQLRHGETRVVVLEAALLVEAGWDSLVDEIWVTSSSEERVVKRLRQRNDLSEEEISARISSQIRFEARSRRAQVEVRNTGSMEDLRKEVESLWRTRVEGRVK